MESDGHGRLREQERGLRVKHQLCSGVFDQRKILAPINAALQKLERRKLRARWLPDAASLTMRKANLNKSMRITWPDGTSVEVNFWDKGPSKSQVALEHRKLENLEDVTRLKAYWSDALAKLQEILSSGGSANLNTRKMPSRK